MSGEEEFSLILQGMLNYLNHEPKLINRAA